MDDLTQRLGRLRTGVDPAWDDGDVAEARSRLDETLRSAATRRRIGALALVAGLGVAALLAWRPWERRVSDAPQPIAAPAAPEPPSSPRHAAPERPAVVTRTDGAARMRVLRDTPDRLELSVDEGRVAFEVDPAAGKQVVVSAGDVVIQVHARSFAVERSTRGVGVWVDDGWVNVVGNDTTAVGAGETLWLAIRAVEQPPRDSAPAPEPETTGADDWRMLARDGRFAEAFAALGGGAVDDDVSALMLAADAARMSGHPRAAVRFLDRVVRDHADDPRAPLASYTLGRVHLHQLGQPREAAAAFAGARQLGLDSSLTEDALAREVEARARAGDDAMAAALAREYVREYPDGRWLRAVRTFGKPE